MAQKDIELLIKDLSARLPYNVYVYFKTRYRCNAITDVLDGAIYTYIETHLLEDDGENEIDIIKPYLRPMSSMTKEERLIYEQRLHDVGRSIDVIDADDVVPHIDWLLSHHFDFRGLISMGLALEAPEGMYNINE